MDMACSSIWAGTDMDFELVEMLLGSALVAVSPYAAVALWETFRTRAAEAAYCGGRQSGICRGPFL